MAKKTRTWLLLGAAALAALFLIARRAVKNITIAASGFRVHKIDLSGVEFRVRMTVTSRGNIAAPISGFIGQLLYAWPQNPEAPSTIGDLRLISPAVMPGFGSVTLEFSVTSGLMGASWELLNILTDGFPTNPGKISYKNIDPTRFKIVGTLQIGDFPVDIETNLVS